MIPRGFTLWKITDVGARIVVTGKDESRHGRWVVTLRLERGKRERTINFTASMRLRALVQVLSPEWPDDTHLSEELLRRAWIGRELLVEWNRLKLGGVGVQWEARRWRLP